jgi:sn-glycerol 3-phosphate transport system substrate-binding protein
MSTQTTLDVWVSDLTFPGYMDRWHKLAAEFEKAHPEYRVEIKGINFFTGARDIAAAVAQGNGPTIADYYVYMSQAARDTRAPDGAPQYTSIEQAIGGRTEILGEPVVLGDIIPAMRQCYAQGGDLFSMPSVGTVFLQYSNTVLLTRAGVDAPPRTWEEVTAAAEAVRAVDGGPDHGVSWPNHGMFYLQALASLGGFVADQDNGYTGRASTIDLASKEMLTWVTWWQSMHRDGNYLHTGGIPHWMESFGAFTEQQVALRISSSNDVNFTLRAAEKAGFEVAVTPFPYNAETPYVGNTIAGSSLWLANRLDETTQDGALAFLQYVHNPRNAADRHKASSFLPLTNAAFALLEEEGWFEENPHHRVASDQLSTFPDGQTEGTPACGTARFGDFAGVQDILTRAVADVLERDADPVGRLTEASAEAQGLLNAYNAEATSATGPRSDTSLRFEYFRDTKPYKGTDMEDVVERTG